MTLPVPGEWTNATTAWDILTSGGVNYGLGLGNHDGAPSSTGNFNTAFGTRISTQSTYGGRPSGATTYDNTYSLFSASGMDFIVLFIEYDDTMTSTSNPILVWANDILAANPTRRAIVVTHNLLDNDGTFSPQGDAIYQALRGNANLFLMMGGHLDGSLQRFDDYLGHRVYSLRSDYQFVNSQQSGYLRILTFRPQTDQIFVETYSPTRLESLTDGANQFTLNYDLAGYSFQQIGTDQIVTSGNGTASVSWAGLDPTTEYEWYAVVDDFIQNTTLPTRSFTTGGAANLAPVISEGASTTISMSEDSSPTAFSLTLHATDANVGDTLTWSVSSPASHGTATAAGTGASQVVAYSPLANYNGTDAFTVQVSDGNGGSDSIIVNVNIAAVNDAPVCSTVTLTIAEDTPGDVAPACTDADAGDVLSYSIVAQGTGGTASVVAGLLHFVPDLNFNGPVTFTYRANDTHVDSNTANANITVSPVNDAPQVTNPGAQSSAEGAAISLQIVATDIDGPLAGLQRNQPACGLEHQPNHRSDQRHAYFPRCRPQPVCLIGHRNGWHDAYHRQLYLDCFTGQFRFVRQRPHPGWLLANGRGQRGYANRCYCLRQ